MKADTIKLHRFKFRKAVSFSVKKKAIVLTITVLFIAIIMYFSPISSANSEKIMITGDLVNVREQPGTAYSIVTQIHKGETYSLLDK